MIRFTHPWRGYAPDDEASLDPDVESRLIALGRATAADPEPEPAPAAKARKAPAKPKDGDQ